MSGRDLANSMIALDWFVDRGLAALKAKRRYAADHMMPGERFAAVLPNGSSPGYVLRKKDTKEPYLADEATLYAYVDETDPQALRDIDELNPAFHAEAMAVLKQHAPHTVVSRVELDPTVLAGYLRAAKASPEKAVPGVAFKTVQGAVAVYPDKSSVAELVAAIRDGQISPESLILQIEGMIDDGAQDA